MSPRLRDWVVAGIAVIAGCDNSTTEPPVPTRLAFDVHPVNAVAGAPIEPQVRVRVLDASGNTFTGSLNVTVTLAHPTAVTLLGTTSVATVGGVATFSDLRIEEAGAGYVLNASSGSLTGATSNAFDVGHAGATKLRFVEQPAEATAGTPVSPAITVELLDPFDNRATSATNTITILRGADSPGFVMGGINVSAVTGLATFNSIALSRPGLYTLRATAEGLTEATSAPLVVNATANARFCPGDLGRGTSFFTLLMRSPRRRLVARSSSATVCTTSTLP